MVAAAALGSATQLRKRYYRSLQLLRQRLQTARDGRNFLGAVLEPLATDGHSRHELQIVDDDEVELPALGLLQPASLGPHFADRDSRRVVDVESGVHQLFHGARELLHLVLAQETFAYLLRVNPCARRQ